MKSAAGRLRILLLTRNLPPQTGGMERLNWHLARELAARSDFAVVGPAGCGDQLHKVSLVAEVPLEPVARFLAGSLARALRVAWTWRPDIVLAGSGLMAPAAWCAARLVGAGCAAYTHGLDLTAPSATYRAVWLPAIRRMDVVFANSRATQSLAHAAGVAPQRTALLHPGVAAATTTFSSEEQLALRRRWTLTGPVLISVGRLTERKGLRPFIRDVLPGLVAAHPGLKLLVIGEPPRAALHAQPENPEALRAAAAAQGIEQHVVLLGRVDERTLQQAYALADLHVFPVRDIAGNPEGFGLVSLEAAAHGCPTVAYAVHGVVDAVAEGRSGWLVPPEKATLMQATILDALHHPLPEEQVRAHAAEHSWDRFAETLYSALQLVA